MPPELERSSDGGPIIRRTAVIPFFRGQHRNL